ncbi:MAG: transglycosylase SLT domain-containing protein [Bacillota bacterium]
MGFRDAIGYSVYDVEQPYGFGAAATRQKQKKPEQPTSPTLAAASTNVNLERRLEAAGEPIPEQKPKQNLLTKALDILNRPGAAVRGAVYEAYSGGGTGRVLEAAKKGFTGRENITGRQVLEKAAERGVPLAQAAQKSKAGQFIGGLATDIVLDPTTYLTGGTAKVAQVGGKGFAKAISKEVARETGRKIAPESAARLAENTLRGEIPVGRLGTAVSRAMGYTAETKPIKTGFGKIAQTQQRIQKAEEVKGFAAVAEAAKGKAQALKQQAKQYGTYSPTRGVTGSIAWMKKEAEAQRGLAKQYKEMASQAKKEIPKIKAPATVGRVAEVAGTPGITKTTLRFMGKPFLDVTPVRTALGAIVEKSATATKVRDALGRVFSFNYTPMAVKGVERALVTGAKERITQATREIPFARERGMKEVAEGWKGTTTEAAEMAPHVIEETVQGTPEARRAAEKAAAMFDYDAKRFAQEGIPLNTIDKYVQHLYLDPPEKVKAVIDRWRRAGAVGARPSFTRKRSIPTLEQAKQLGLTPIEDVRQLTMIHRALTEQAVVLQEMGRDLVKMGRGVVQNSNPGGWVSVTDSGIPALQGKWVHPEVAKGLANLYPIITNSDEGVRIATKAIDSAIRAWKALVLFRPAFHLRNFIGNVFLNIADGMGNPLRYPQAAAVLTEAIPYVEIAGRQVPTKVVKECFAREALRGQGMFMEAAGARTVTEEAVRMLQALQRNGFQNVAYWARHPFSASRAFGEHTDSLGRMANFLHHLDSGMSPAQAAERTRRALFDYGELTKTEQEIRRWVYPFYAWVRFSTPRMLERLLGAPGIFTGPTHIREAAVNLNEVDEKNMPQWLRDNQAIPLWVDEKGNLHYLSLNLPYTELSRLRDPRDFQEWAKEIVTMVNPYITVPFQIAQNEMLFNDQKITEFEEIGGAPMLKDYGKFLLGHLGMSRQLVNQLGEWERQKQYEQAIAEGKGVEVPPVERGITEKLGITSAQSPAQWARSAEYRRGKLLEQAIKAARLQGKEIPETKDFPALGEKKGGFGAALTARGGGGFGAVLRQQALKEVGEPPVVIKQAMDMAGVDQTWGLYLKLLIQSESGGNPMAVNPLWVNYNTGQTSRRKEGPGWYQATGLFQMMKPTFDQYKAPGHDDIFNPLDNTLAAINYIKSRYGHPANIPGLGEKGYSGY